MPDGRKPKLSVISDRKPHRSNSEIESRSKNEPGGCDAKFRSPRNLTAEAKKEWRRLIKLYKQLDVPILNDLDITMLTSYCESWAIYYRALADYQAEPWNGRLVVQRTKGGPIIENPFVKIMTREGQNMAKYAEQLCLSPVGRARMGIAKAKQEEESDPMFEVLSRR